MTVSNHIALRSMIMYNKQRKPTLEVYIREAH